MPRDDAKFIMNNHRDDPLIGGSIFIGAFSFRGASGRAMALYSKSPLLEGIHLTCHTSYVILMFRTVVNNAQSLQDF